MNILIPHTWLKEHLETEADPKTIQKNVSLCGPSVERIYDIEGDNVYDIEVTTNRVDSMSVRGIARETAVILKQFDIKAELKPLTLLEDLQPEVEPLPLPKIINDPELSKRVICVVLQGVKRNPTPEWMAKRLLQTEQNVHDAVIDITNYVTHELGHPCHAFDYDKLMNTGGEINIVEAKSNETFTTLDGNEFTTVGGEVVFKNGEGEIIDLPSIKGTVNTSIDDSTQNVLLLLESITAEKVRFASMTHAIRTTAAQLMEKHVDPELAKTVLLRGVELYRELCEAKIASPIYDDFPGKVEPTPVIVPLHRITDYLGLTIETDRIVSILETLGCTTTVSDEVLTVTPPTFRPDIAIPADVIEEIARIYGYHNLPSTLMDTPIPTTKPSDVDFVLENRIKHFLANIGWQEIYSYSMVSEAIAKQSGYALDGHLALQNPLTDDRIYMRRSLVPSLEEIIAQNAREEHLSVFEIANVYHPLAHQLPSQELMLTMVSTDQYTTVKGALEAVMCQFFVENVKVKPIDGSHLCNSVQCGEVWVGNNLLGSIMVLPTGHTAAELQISQLMKVAQKHPTYHSIPKTAEVREDITLTLPEKTLVGEVIKTLQSSHELITSIELKDVYHQNYTFAITYWQPEENLSSADVEPARKALVEAAEAQYSAQLVGEI
ncbi:MAG: phenylalanine--tRNA ligase subunit beta [Pseudomonadales bacterium]|nr:phenylalanine--tRNA ligase subunit beta [Candidatus Woesebacteria bacterium]MCB9801183.1 phenylalanine--tRNA ligase subunit beta [Pseudomonadales bacterium]